MSFVWLISKQTGGEGELVAEGERRRAGSQLRDDHVDVSRLTQARQQWRDGAHQTAGRRKTHLLLPRTQVYTHRLFLLDATN